MRLSLSLALAAPFLMLAPAVASAQDAPSTDTRLPFDGLYVAASGGYDVQKNDVGSSIRFDRNGDGQFNDTVTTATGADAFSPGFCNGRARGATRLPGGCENDRDGASYYGRVGLDKQGGPFVLGVLGEFGKTDIRDYTSGFSTTPAAYVFSRRVDWEASGRARAGFAAGNGLFYATGGVGYARFKNRFTTTNTANSFTTLRNDRDRFGYVVGGGVEYRVMKHASIGLEYSYHDYKDSRYQIRVGQGTAPATNPFVLAPFTTGTTISRSDGNFRWHSLRGVIGYHF